MGDVIADLSMSLDGFVAYPDDMPGAIFDWYESGPVEVRTANPGVTAHLSAESAAYFRDTLDNTGVVLTGRRLFDITDGWGGVHPSGAAIVCVSHRGPEGWTDKHPDPPVPVRFVSTGIEDALAVSRELAGGKNIAVAGPNLIQQYLNAGLVDELQIHIAPMFLGGGARLFGDHVASAAGKPQLIRAVESPTGAMHLKYEVVDR